MRDIRGDIIYLALYSLLSDRIETGKGEKGKHYLLAAGFLACGDSPQRTQGETARAIVNGAIGFSPAEIDALEALDLMHVGMNIMS